MPKKQQQQKEEEPQASVISLINQKGGAGKTAATTALATIFGESGLKVLVVDSDAQGHASFQFGFDYEYDQSQFKGTTSDLYLAKATAQEIALDTGYKGVSIVPASIELSEVEMNLVGMRGSDLRLKVALDKAKNFYDLIIVDSPPNLGKLSMNVLCAADWFLVPVDGPGALRSVGIIQRAVQENSDYYPGLTNQFLGIFVNANERTNIMGSIKNQAEKLFPGKVFNSEIRRATQAKEAFALQKPLPAYAPKSPIVEDYRHLASEIRERIGL